MLTIRITVAAIVLLIQASQCLASNDSPFILRNTAITSCLVHCLPLRWISNDRIFIPRIKKCLGTQGKSVGSEISFYDCDEKSEIQKWECKNQTLLALKGENLYIILNEARTPVLSREAGPNSHFTISGTSDGACSRTYRELYSIGGNAFGRPCMFPFQYKDRWFADCTTHDASVRRAWCAVETKYEHQLWGYCPSTSTEHWRANPVTGAYYQINSQSALTWHQAKISCEQQRASILSIIDPHEQSYIIGLLGSGHFRLWIGLILDQEHGWQWTDGRPFRYLRWDSGHPLPDPGNNCAVMDSAVQYSWQSSLCTRKMGYICHKGGTSPPPYPVETGFCSNPWIPYNGHCFHLQRTKKAWSEAQQECRKEGGGLASIHNIEDQSFVISQLGYAASDELWIGLNDRRTEGLFDWSDGSTVTFTSWEFGKPRPSGASEDCVIITGENGNWADSVCTEKHGFICMKMSASQPSGDEVEFNVGCKPGWKRHGSYCYLVGSETKNFDEAKEHCKSSESYLADVSNGVDNAFLVSLVGMRPERHFWLGLSNQISIDYFVWTNANPVKFTHWNAEMPGSRQGCVAMTTGILAGLWDVLPCTDKVKYICKHLAEGAVLTPAPPTLTPPSCAEGWKPVPTRSSCFKLFTGPRSGEKTWFEARDYCQAIGGDLLSIHSSAELPSRQRQAWIGLSIPDPQSGWVWSDGSALNFQHWLDGEPNNRMDLESCANIRMYNRDEPGSWNDVHCESYNDWLCQIRAGVTPKPPPNNTVSAPNITRDGWLVWGENQYYINNNDMAMEDARHFCRQRHGDLAVINSEAENIFLWKQISKTYNNFYIGLTVDLDGSYEWMDGSPMAFQRWDENQPDFKNSDENCVVMTYNMGFWHDYNCGAELGSICKRSGTPPVNSTVAPTVPPKGGCPIDWSLFDSKCFRIIQNQKNTWHQARAQCQGMGGNLVSIVSRHVQVFLITQMAEAASTDLWIGLNSVEKYQYLWTDGRARRYTNWGYKGSIQRFLGYFHKLWTERECVVMTISASIGIGKWMTKSCNDTNGYVCQRNVDPNIPTSPESTTPNTYVKLGNDSFRVMTQNLTWKDARKRCEAEGAQLASLRNHLSQAYAELQALNLQAPLWIGLNKIETEGYFRFIDGWHLSISKWGRDEPRRKRPCVYLDVDGAWKTAFCNETFNSICMQSTDVPPTMSTQYPGICPEEVVTDQSEEALAWMPFRGHCYIFITENLDWSNAASSCQRHDGFLASIEDPSEQNFIEEKLRFYQDGYNSFWIGLFKTYKGKWLWLDKTVMDYTNWRDEEAHSNSYGRIQSSDGKWSTGQRWLSRPYICKTAKVIRQHVSPTSAPPVGEAHHRVHTALAVLLVITVLSVLAVTAFLLYKKSGCPLPLPLPLPTFDNPLFFENERSQPNVVDTNKLIENAVEENSEPMITL